MFGFPMNSTQTGGTDRLKSLVQNRFGEVPSIGILFQNEGIIEYQVTKCVFLQGNWIYVFLDPCLVNIRLDRSCRNISFALFVYLRNPSLL